ncbi:MAG TPA: universal stress protein, partial [Opitutaceae bacterium]|nr:universal stress protein [Opitutaceae bacterium]
MAIFAQPERSSLGKLEFVKTILVSIDFSEVTGLVVDEAIELAKPSGARLVILHVAQPPAVVADYGPPTGGLLLPVPDALGPRAARQLAKWRRIVEERRLPVSTAQLTGDPPAQLIASEAARRSADYIVMGSHGHTAFYDLL